MASENPYQPPAIPAEWLEPEWPPSGVFHDGYYLVLHHASTLPPICIKTGLPAETYVSADLVGGLPNDDSVPATRKKWYGDKVYAIQIPLSHTAQRRSYLLRLAGGILAAITLVAALMAAVFYLQLRVAYLEVVPTGLVIGMILSLALFTEARHQLRLECVARGYFWIANPPKKYLRMLPPWPVPRPSWWRRAFFGPAGVSGSSKKKLSEENSSTGLG